MAWPPPSRPVMTVSATHEASDAATAASAALPPARRISTPASAVCGCPAATPATGSSAAAARNHPADADEARLEELDEQPFLVAVRNAEDAVARRDGDRRDGLVRVGDLDCEAAVRGSEAHAERVRVVRPGERRERGRIDGPSNRLLRHEATPRLESAVA